LRSEDYGTLTAILKKFRYEGCGARAVDFIARRLWKLSGNKIIIECDFTRRQVTDLTGCGHGDAALPKLHKVRVRKKEHVSSEARTWHDHALWRFIVNERLNVSGQIRSNSCLVRPALSDSKNNTHTECKHRISWRRLTLLSPDWI
jgi:hypothetical protein